MLVIRSDTLKASLKDFSMPTESLEQIAWDREKWRGLTRRGAVDYDAKIISEAEQKRAQRKARARASPTELSSSDLCCSVCNRQLRAKIGLISHFRIKINKDCLWKQYSIFKTTRMGSMIPKK